MKLSKFRLHHQIDLNVLRWAGDWDGMVNYCFQMCRLNACVFPIVQIRALASVSYLTFEKPSLQVLPFKGRALGACSDMWDQKEQFMNT